MEFSCRIQEGDHGQSRMALEEEEQFKFFRVDLAATADGSAIDFYAIHSCMKTCYSNFDLARVTAS